MPRLVRPFGGMARCLVLAAVAGAIAALTLPPTPAQSVSSATTRLDWGVKPSMSIPRFGLGLAAAPNGKLYAVGGSTGTGAGTPVASVEEYDPATNTWATKASMLGVRTGVALAAAPNGKLYAVGGGTTVEEYDPVANVWIGRAPLPTGRSFLGLAAAPNGKLYAVGGSSGATVEEYDPAANTWTAKAPMSVARSNLGLAAATNGKLYAVGGIGVGSTTCQPSGICATVEEYDPATNLWTTRAPLPSPTYSLGLAAAPNGKIYAVGGAGAVAGFGTAVLEYDPATDTWTAKAPMPSSRSSLGLATAPNGRLYAVGGTNGISTFATTEEYDPAANAWASKPAREALPAPARNFPTSAVAGGRLYVFGGFGGLGGGTSLPDVHEYDPATNAWRAVAPMPTARSGAAAATAPNGRIYVLGGVGSSGSTLQLVEEFTPPTAGAGPGSWRGPPAIVQPAFARENAGFALAANGKLYAVGGTGRNLDAGETFGRILREVEEYDPSAPATTAQWREVAPMAVARNSLTLARAGDSRLYAVGGDIGPGPANTVERFTPPTSSFTIGSWAGPGGVAQLPGPRRGMSMIGAPNGNLYAMGGNSVDDFADNRADVFEYDHVANAWTAKAPMPTGRSYFALGPIGHRLFAVGGFGAPSLNEEAVIDNLPTGVSAGGPYNVAAGANVQLAATGSDPDGDALSYAWDVNGDLLYETAGQNPTASTAGLAPGVRTVRVRALDPKGGYALASATLTVTAADRLAFSTQPAGSLAGAPLARQPVVQALDAQGRLVPAFSGPVTVALGTNPGGATLGGTVTVNAVNGVATFAGLTVSAVGSGYTLVATAPGLASATSTSFAATGPCDPRPNVTVQTVTFGPGQIRATLRAGHGTLAGTLQIGPPGRPIQNASVDVQGGPSGIIASQDVAVSGSEVVLTVTRRAPGPVMVPLVVTDSCGSWPTFVGFGPGI